MCGSGVEGRHWIGKREGTCDRRCICISNALTEKIPLRWQHVIVWGGLRGALALALALSLDSTFPERTRVLDLTFGVVVFSILVQGLTVKPLLRILGLANGQA